jgi:hypothetical protein
MRDRCRKNARDGGRKATDPGREKSSAAEEKPHKGKPGPRGYLANRVKEKARAAAKNGKAGAAVAKPKLVGSR